MLNILRIMCYNNRKRKEGSIMENRIENTIKEWDRINDTIRRVQKTKILELQNVLRITYKVLTELKDESLVPKNTCKLMLIMEEFLFYISAVAVAEELPICDHYQKLFSIIQEMENGFLNSNYQSTYPKFEIKGPSNQGIVFDFENDSLEEFFMI